MSSPPNSLPELPQETELSQVVSSEPSENPPWTGWDVLRIALVAMGAIFIFSITIIGVAASLGVLEGASPSKLARAPLLVIPAQFLSYVVIVIFMYAIVTRKRNRFLFAVRWNWPQSSWPAYVAVGAIVAISGQLLSALLPIPKSLPIDQFFNSSTDAYIMTAFGVTVAPFVEELFFRGFLYPVLARRLGVLPGVVLTSVPFALVHASQLGEAWGPLLVLFIVGLVLTIVRALTKSVAACMLAHIGYNLTLFTMLFFATDHFRHLEKISQ